LKEGEFAEPRGEGREGDTEEARGDGGRERNDLSRISTVWVSCTPSIPTTIPNQLIPVQKPTRRRYWICPLDMSGQNTLALLLAFKLRGKKLTRSAGKMLKNATMPFGVVAGTRSSAAERMIT